MEANLPGKWQSDPLGNNLRGESLQAFGKAIPIRSKALVPKIIQDAYEFFTFTTTKARSSFGSGTKKPRLSEVTLALISESFLAFELFLRHESDFVLADVFTPLNAKLSPVIAALLSRTFL